MLRTAAEYDTDFALWAEMQAAALRERRFEDLDLANLIEEVDDLSNRKRDALFSRLVKLQFHLLKLKYQPGQASASWRGTIREQARKIRRLLKTSPSLRRELPGFSAEAYPDAREQAADETGLPMATFPELPPSELEQAVRDVIDYGDFKL
jgi:hypothetical protein